MRMTALVFIAAASLLLANPAPTVANDSRFDLIRSALDGDLYAAERLLDQFPDSGPLLIVSAQAHREAGQIGDAVATLERAMRLGSRQALWLRVVHHIERREWIEGYAWGRLAMLVEKHDADDEIEEDNWPAQWTWQYTQKAARNLRDSEFPTADARTLEVVETWYDTITSAEVRVAEDLPTFTRKTAPVYPRDKALANESGWSILVVRFDQDGSANEVLQVAQTNQAFARRARAALERWEIDPTTADPTRLDSGFFQTIEFTMQR